MIAKCILDVYEDLRDIRSIYIDPLFCVTYSIVGKLFTSSKDRLVCRREDPKPTFWLKKSPLISDRINTGLLKSSHFLDKDDWPTRYKCQLGYRYRDVYQHLAPNEVPAELAWHRHTPMHYHEPYEDFGPTLCKINSNHIVWRRPIEVNVLRDFVGNKGGIYKPKPIHSYDFKSYFLFINRFLDRPLTMAEINELNSDSVPIYFPIKRRVSTLKQYMKGYLPFVSRRMGPVPRNRLTTTNTNLKIIGDHIVSMYIECTIVMPYASQISVTSGLYGELFGSSSGALFQKGPIYLHDPYLFGTMDYYNYYYFEWFLSAYYLGNSVGLDYIFNKANVMYDADYWYLISYMLGLS